MAEWIELNPADLFPSSIVDLVEACGTVGDSVATVLEVSADVLDVVKNFVGGYVDPLTSVVSELQDLIASTVQAFTQTGVYVLKHVPLSSKLSSTPSRWLSEVASSLDDIYDESRPILVDENAYVGAAVMLATSRYYKDVMQIYSDMMELFDIVIPSLDQISKWKSIGEEFEVVSGVGRAPDWESKRLIDYIPELGKIADIFVNFSDSISTARTATDLYDAFANQLRDKANVLRSISDTVEALSDSIASKLGFEGAYILPIYGQGDKAWLQGQLVNSTGGPLDLEDANFSVGVVFLATGGTSEPADLLFTLMGLSV